MNSALLVQQHPLIVVEQLISNYDKPLIFTYSRYEIAPPGLQAEARRSGVLRVAGRDLTPGWLGDRLAELGPTEEMAWHSQVECNGAVFHIPMIDFVDRPAESTLRKISRILTSETGLPGEFIFFETGRSFHGYFPSLISQNTWPGYLGQLLLINQLDRPPVIDIRWVGHALVRGFAALRWSQNTNRYLAMPRLLHRAVPLQPAQSFGSQE